VLDVNDKDATGKTCMNDPEDPDGFEDADGCPDPDNDKDSVVDLEDQCPAEPGPPGGDKPGCPKKPSLVIVTAKEIKITQQIHFEFDKDKIRSESFPILDAVADVLKTNPNIKIDVQGHTDNKGGSDYNKKLSDRRAARSTWSARGSTPRAWSRTAMAPRCPSSPTRRTRTARSIAACNLSEPKPPRKVESATLVSRGTAWKWPHDGHVCPGSVIRHLTGERDHCFVRTP
jgi:hypothetical protein